MNNNKKSDIERDVRLARLGDPEAFSRLILANERNLYGLARLYLKREEDCADAVQETIVKSFAAMPALKEPAYFKTWLSRILIHECLQLLRSQQRQRTVARVDEVADAMPYEAIELKEAVAHLEDDFTQGHSASLLQGHADQSDRQNRRDTGRNGEIPAVPGARHIGGKIGSFHGKEREP